MSKDTALILMYVAGLDEIAKKTLRCYKYINVIFMIIDWSFAIAGNRTILRGSFPFHM